MAQLEKQITRDISFHENRDGAWYYKVTEGEKEIMESDLYQTSTECVCAGFKFLDALHVESPLRSNYIPTVADFIYVIDGDKK